MTDKNLRDELQDAAGWVEHQMTPAPDYERLLQEAHDRIAELESTVEDRDATIDGLHSYCEGADRVITALGGVGVLVEAEGHVSYLGESVHMDGTSPISLNLRSPGMRHILKNRQRVHVTICVPRTPPEDD